MAFFDVFKPKWQHSDLAVRKQAVQELESSNLDALIEIAKTEKDAEIRKIAVLKISSANHLTAILQGETDESVRNAIKESLKNQWFKLVKNHIGAPTAEIRQVLADLQPKDIEELIRVAKSTEVRLECIDKCTKQGLLSQVAVEDPQESVALAALSKVQRENLIKEILDESKHASVRKKAKEILSEIKNAKIDPEKEQTDSLLQKQKALLSHATRLLESKNIIAQENEVSRLSAEASSLGVQAETLGLTEKQNELKAVFVKLAENIAAQKASIAEEEKAKIALKETKEETTTAAPAVSALVAGSDESKETESISISAEEKNAEEKPADSVADSEEKNSEEKLSEEEYNAKLPLLQKIIDKVNSLDENGDFNEISQSIRQAFYDWREIVGEKKTQFKNAYKDFRASTSKFQNLQEWASWHAEQTREGLIKEIEALANSPVVLENRAKAFGLLEQWKQAGYMPAAKLQEFWPKFKAGLDKVMESVSPLLKEQEQGQEDNFKQKEQICEALENVAAAEGEWGEQLKKVQELQAKWKMVGFVPKDKNHALWERYQNAISEFFKKQENYRKQKGELINERIAAREKLCADAEALSNSTDWINTPKIYTKLRADWKTAGSVPTEQYEALLARFKAACDIFFENRSAYFENSKNKREELCTRIEALNFEAGDAAAAANSESAAVAKIAEWKKIEEEWKALIAEGSGSFAKELDARFYAVSDMIWETLSKTNPEIAKELDKNWDTKHGLTEKLKTILEQGNFKYKTLQTVRGLQQEWQKTGRCGLAEVEIAEKFNELVRNLFDEYNDQKEIRNNLDKVNSQKKEDLCAKAEALLENAKKGTLNRTEVISEANALRGSWRESGNVSPHLAKQLWDRFNNACNAACHSFEENE
ncbi:hypothetical protein AGMMS49938_00370 [Fibrobacterales bacterium]|nr:hypothetical protein AGMMS49938_00370 [Fibrobacterales bacterium]